jgi:hypothetical protein
MCIEKAIAFTCHSWRHFLPMVSRQIGQSNDQSEEVGGWKPGSDMPKRYDNIKCGKSLLAKAQCWEAIAGGWNPALDGEIPKPTPPSKWDRGNCSVFPEIPPLEPDQKVVDPSSVRAICSVEDARKELAKLALTPDLTPEVDPTTGILGVPVLTKRAPAKRARRHPRDPSTHVISSGNIRHLYPNAISSRPRHSKCGMVECGTPDSPATGFKFWANGSITQEQRDIKSQCGSCWSASMTDILPVEAFEDSAAPDATVVSSSSEEEPDNPEEV